MSAASDLGMDRDVGKDHKSSVSGNLCFSVTSSQVVDLGANFAVNTILAESNYICLLYSSHRAMSFVNIDKWEYARADYKVKLELNMTEKVIYLFDVTLSLTVKSDSPQNLQT